MRSPTRGCRCTDRPIFSNAGQEFPTRRGICDGIGLSTAQMIGTNATDFGNMGGLDFSATWTATDSYPLQQWSVADLKPEPAGNELTGNETTDATVTATTADGREIGFIRMRPFLIREI